MGTGNGKPTVAIYVRYFLSPSETFVYRQLQGISDAFHPIVLTTEVRNPELFPFDEIHARNKTFVDKVQARAQGFFTGQFSVLATAQRKHFTRVLASRQARLIHAHFGHYGLDVLPLASALGMPLLVTLHGHDASVLLRNATYVRNLRELVEHAHVITVSHNMVDRLAGVGVHPRRLRVHYIGVPIGDFAFVERKPVRDKLREGELVRFLQVSNFVKKKGHEYTVRAFARYLPKHPASELVLAGDGPCRPEIEQLCRELGVDDHVRFTGTVAKDRVRELMAEADVFVHHSVTPEDGSMEGLPTVLMEAMATGLVCISSWHSGIPELIDDGVNGFLVHERDVDGYVERLEALAEVEPDLPARARGKVENQFDMAQQNAELQAIYEEIVAARGEIA